MRNAGIACLLLASLGAGGCAVGPDYHRPEVASASRFVGQPAVAARSAAAPSDLVSWWNGFDDPLMTQLIEEALDHNLDVAQAVGRVSQAKAGLHSANAALLPSAQITANAASAHQSLETPTGRLLSGVPGFSRDGELYDGGVSASWEIDLFGGLRRGQEAARAGYLASQADVAGARILVAAQTAETYVAIRGLQNRIAIATEQVDTQRRLVGIIDLQYRKGIAAELQLNQAKGALSQVAATLPVLREALESAMNSLDVLLGSQPGSNRDRLSAPKPIPVPPAIADAGGPAELLRRRPDLLASEQRLIAANARIGEAVSQYYPKLSLGGLLGTATTAAGGLFGSGATQAQGVLGLRWRIFDFGRVDAEIAAARGRDAEALAAYRLAVLRASEDVENAFSSLVQRELQERTLAEGEDSLARARKASFAAYEGGVVSLIEVLDADNRLLATRDARIQARTEAARAAISSFGALGGGWSSAERAAL